MTPPNFLPRTLCLALGCTLAFSATAATTTAYWYQTKTPYQPQQQASTYEAAPAGFKPVFTEMLARHGSRGLSSLKYDLAVYNMWLQAQADGALTPLGASLGPDVYTIMKANFLLGYGVEGISKPGYGNETQLGISEHKALAQRLVSRLQPYWKQVANNSVAAPRQVVVVTSGVDRAVDSGHYFTESLLAAKPALAKLVTTPAAPGPYPDVGTPVAEPAGTDRFELYFHKLVAATDLVTNTADPHFVTYTDSQAYQAYKGADADLLSRQAALQANPAVGAAGRVILERLFAKAFVDKIENGSYSFANTGTYSFTSDDGKFTSTLTGDGKTKINSLASAAALLYELYSIAPAMKAEAGVNFKPYMPQDQAEVVAELNDASDFYDKGPGFSEKGSATWKMAQGLVDDFFQEADAIAAGDLTHAAKLRFAHAETVIPFASAMGLKNVLQQVPLAQTYSYASNPWRGVDVSPMAANMQWDLYRNKAGQVIVKMLYNEAETDFKAACDGAKLAGTQHFYDYAQLRSCYGY